MKNRLAMRALAISAFTLGAALSGQVLAVDNNGPIDEAMASGLVGEQSDGFLGFVRAPSADQADLQRRVNEVNIKRRTVYIQVARDSGETLDRVAVLQALRQIGKAPNGEFFKDMTNKWCAKGPGSDVRQAPDDTIVIRCTRAGS